MILFTPAWIIAFTCAFVFFGAGKQNTTIPGGKNRSYFWAFLSIAVSALVIRFFSAGWILVLVSQLVLFAAIGLIGAIRDRDEK